MVNLAKAARAELEVLARSRERAEADRARALLLTAQRLSGPEIGRVLGVKADTVRHWRSAYRRRGIKALRRHPPPGPSAHRGRRALEVLEMILAEPLAPGMPPWTLPRLQHELERRCGVHLSQPWISCLLRKKGAIAFGARATRSKAGKTARPSRRAPSS